MDEEPNTRGLQSRLPALQSRDFRLFWFGQMVSLTGTWVQSVAQQWLVLKLTGSAFKLGLVTALQFTPLLVLALLGGAVSDRFPKRNLLLATQIISCVLAIVLGILVQTHLVRYWHVLVFAALLGTVNAFYTPARQAFVPELVEKDHLLNAVALNSAIFNGARVVGPALGGLLIAYLSLSLNFFLNAASYLAVIGGLLLISPRARTRKEQDVESLWQNTLEGLRYVRDTPVIYTILALIGVASLFALNFATIMPIFANGVLHVGAKGYGFLMAAVGVGALGGAILIAFINKKDSVRAFIYTGAFVFTAAEIAFAVSRSYGLSLLLLVIVGLFFTLFTTTCNTRVLSLTPSDLQGRVMSVYTLVFFGITPFGSLLSGLVAEHLGAPFALGVGAAITLAFTAVVFAYRPSQRARARAEAQSPT